MQKQVYSKKTKHIIVFLISLIYVICPEAPWTYSQCFDYLNGLDIICDKIYKADNGDEICEKLKFLTYSSMGNMPKECFNQQYKLSMNINNPSKPIKKSVILFLTYYNIENNEDNLTELDLDEENFDFYNKKIEECLKNHMIYNQKCLNNKFLEKEDYCKELKKTKDLNYCKSLVDDVSKQLRNQIQFALKDKIPVNFGSVKFQFENDNNYYPFEIKYSDFEGKDKDKDYSCNGNNRNDEQENELEEYNNNSGKDCVEYGLTSLKDNIIFCTKYE